MFPSAWSTPLWLVSSYVVLAHCSVEFFIDQSHDQCSRNNNAIACSNNTNSGGLCAYAPDANMLWCCPASDPSCWGFGRNCTGGSSGAPGPGQISCSNEGAQWCCDQNYEVCTQAANQINICTTNFANADANVSIAEANAIESSSTSSSSQDATPLSSISTALSTSLSKATTSSSLPVPSPSSSPNASKSSSDLASGAIAGIVIAAVVVVSCLVGFLTVGILRTRRGQGNKGKVMPPIKGYDASTMGNDSMKVELDGEGLITELPSQDMRHQMI